MRVLSAFLVLKEGLLKTKVLKEGLLKTNYAVLYSLYNKQVKVWCTRQERKLASVLDIDTKEI
ncbi:unnamed protein product [Prunus armeniaca]|uniref:Uncharacterized protein n=1 Tax=Prunus armeniaca TaxID=36596 RepID=A0A6J5VH82_PRUAR|nr:unnamed protein product [Prunus armeniaca]